MQAMGPSAIEHPHAVYLPGFYDDEIDCEVADTDVGCDFGDFSF